jgi:hypothetical protein
MSATSIRESIARAREAGNQAQVDRLHDALATWETSVRKKRESIEEELTRLFEVLDDLEAHYNDRIAQLERSVGADLDPFAGARSCDADLPRVKSLDEQIAECLTQADLPRDVCLANLVLLHQDPAPCGAAPQGRCAELVGRIIMGECAPHEEPLRSACEHEAAAWINQPRVCQHATHPYGCIATVAAEQSNPSIIMDHIDDPTGRATMLGTYATLTGDATVFDLIEDNALHDNAVIYAAARLGFGSDKRLDLGYCDQLRGNYAGEYAEDDEAMNRNLCRGAVLLSNYALDRDNAASSQAQREEIVRDFQDLVERLESGETTIEDLLQEAGIE